MNKVFRNFKRGLIVNPVLNLIPDDALAKAVNVDFSREGAIRVRKGMSQINSFGDKVHSHFRSKSRYTAAGTKLYRGSTEIASGLSGGRFQFVTMQPYKDQKEWTFMANGEDAGMKKDDGSNLYNWGIDAPTTAPTVVDTGIAGNPNGTYTYKITFVNSSTGFESNGSPASSEITVAGTQIKLTSIPTSSDAQVDQRKIYRKGGTKTDDYYLVDTIDDNTTTTYTDNKADGDLTDLLVENNDPPPNGSKICEHKGYIYMAGVCPYSQRVYWSRQYQPEAFPSFQYIEIGSESDPPMALVSSILGVFVFTKTKIYRIEAGQASYSSTNSHVGTIAPYTVVPTAYGIFFMGNDYQIYLFKGMTSECISDRKDGLGIAPILKGEAVNGLGYLNQDKASESVAIFHDNKYYLSYPEYPSSIPNKMLVFDALHGRWWQDSRGFTALHSELGTTLVGGTYDGYLYELETGSSDAGADIKMEVELKKYPLSVETAINLLRRYRVDMDTKGDTVTVAFDLDDTEILSDSVNTTRAKAFKRRNFPSKKKGHLLQPKITYTGQNQVEFYSIEIEFEPLRAR